MTPEQQTPASVVGMLREAVIDYDGAEIPDGAAPRRDLDCGEMRAIAALIERLSAEREALAKALGLPAVRHSLDRLTFSNCTVAEWKIVSEARAVLSTQGESRQTGWQDIATAPKDGTKFDAWDRDGRITDVYWSDVQEAFCTDGDYGPEEPSPLAFFPAPTHWMPLPAAPTPAEGNGG